MNAKWRAPATPAAMSEPAPAGAPVLLAWARISEIGMRASNQDALGEALCGPLSCFVIADGAGGHEGGEVAAKIVVSAMLGGFKRAPGFSAAALQGYADRAIAEVALGKQAERSHADMSATMCALVVDGATGHALWAHLGDSRVYLFRAGRVRSVSKDHSMTQQLIDAGYAKADQLRSHPQRNLLYAAVGAEGETPVDVTEQAHALLPGDALLLCSDGLWEWVHERDMEATLGTSTDSQQWLAAMCRIADAAVQAAGRERDNYSAYAILVRELAP